MRSLLALGVAVCLLFPAAFPLRAQSNQLLQGTQLRLVLLNGLSTAVARDGDPFLAVVTEPVYIGGQLVLPAGAKVHGVVGTVVRPKRFSVFRGQAGMNLQFQSIEVDNREIPAQMSLLSIYDSTQATSHKRKDLQVEEGAVVEAKPDIKGDITTVGVATAGGTAAGAVFSHVVRGLAIGMIGGTAYVLAKKGKEVELPAHTGILVRLDNTVALPAAAAKASPYASSPR